jgi:WD40 repeat protein
MIDRYDAFISYKHAELDSDIAATVQRQLEHFHVPGSIRKLTGKNKISRIFRDKEELPITSSLTDTISRALAVSDNLIVICSTKTKESIWVDREIRTFLQTHDRSHVFTVLADGEPFEVIPEVLLYEEESYFDGFGNHQINRKPIEPLSCDYRIGKKAANKIEIPRLAAAIIGCSYDELINRSRQYAMRRMTAIMTGVVALSVGFGAYMFYSSVRVNNALKESLKNQSRYLASESESLLSDERRIPALQLALAALPSESDPSRPVTCEAIRALTDASLAYKPSDGFDYAPYWNFQMPSPVKEIAPSQGGKYLAVRDSGNLVKCWNPYTHEELLTVGSGGSEVLSMLSLDDDRLLIIYENRADLYGIEAEKLIWSFDVDGLNLFDGGCFLTNENTVVFSSKYGFYSIVDLKDGSMLEYDMFSDISEDKELKHVEYYGYKMAPTKDKLAFAVYDTNYDFQIGILDLKTKEVTYSDTYDQRIENMCWDRDGLLYASMREKNVVTTGWADSRFYNYIPNTTKIVAFDATDFSEKWTYSFDSNEAERGSGFFYLEVTDSIFYYVGNMGAWLDATTGEELGLYDTNDTIIGCTDTDNSGRPFFFTYSGLVVMPFEDGGKYAITTMKMSPSNTIIASIIGGMFFVRDGDTEVTGYMINMRDTEFTVISDEISPTGFDENYYMSDDYLTFMRGGQYSIYDTKGKKYIGSVSLDKAFGKEADDLYMLPAYDGKLYLQYIDDQQNLVLGSIDAKTLQTETTVYAKNYVTSVPFGSMHENMYLFITVEDDVQVIHQVDLSTGEELEYTPKNASSRVTAPRYIEDSDYGATAGDVDRLMNLSTGKEIAIEPAEDWQVTLMLGYDKKSDTFVRTDGVHIELINSRGKVTKRLSDPGSAVIGMKFYGDYFLAACSDGSLYKYSTANGKLLDKTDLTVTYFARKDQITRVDTALQTLGEEDKDYTCWFTGDQENGLVYVQVGSTMDIIDMDDFYEITSIENSLGYHQPSDTFWAYSINNEDESCDVGYYRHYTLEELIDKAKDSLSGSELSDEMKAKYGLK